MERIPVQALRVLQTMEENGFQACLVGGCVRDLLRGKTPQDWDMTTSARPEQVMELFCDMPVIPTGIAHGTVTLATGFTLLICDFFHRTHSPFRLK